MVSVRKFRALAGAVAVAAALGGCAGSSAPPSQQSLSVGAVVSSEEGPAPDGTPSAQAAAIRRMTYVSKSGVDDSYTRVTASIYSPAGAPPPGGFRVVAYGRAVGTPTPDCAFSDPVARQGASGVIDTFLKAGYVVVVPDYQNLGSPSDGRGPSEGQRLYHPALDSATVGYNLIDAAHATRELLPDTSPIWLAAGQVQGGQGAWAVDELIDNHGYASYRGSAVVSPTADPAGLADAAAEGALTPDQQLLFIGYLNALAQEYEGWFRLDDYRRGAVKENWNLLLSCNPADDVARSEARARIGPDDLRPATPQALSVLRSYLAKTTLPQGPTQQPMLVVYDDDPLTPAPWTERALARACGLGDSITIRRQPAPSLTDPAVLDWMAGRAREEPVTNDCPSFVADHPVPPSTPTPAPAPAPAAPAPPSPLPAGAEPVAAPAVPAAGGVSLIDGWLPVGIQAVAAAALIAATGWRTRRWRLRWVPVALAAGVALIGVMWWVFTGLGWGQKYPLGMWLWIGCTGMAAAVVLLGWPGSPWWRRVLALVSVPLCVLAAATAVNASLGYLPTVETAWLRATGKQPPQWIDQTKLRAMQREGFRPTRGTVVSITTPSDVSGFAHRQEYVYLPPAWFASSPPPRLPVVMMIGAELSTPADWLQSGRALGILDNFALQHHGVTPVVVFPDTSGSFANDTECVNGPRGNAADHITKEFVPYVVSNFGVSPQASSWGVVGWSSGGTCSVMLLVTQPEMFSAIVDLDGQLGPNAGTKRQTIARLFGGDAEAWARFDPRTVVESHGPYRDKAAWIAVSEQIPTTHRPGRDWPFRTTAEDWDNYSEDHAKTAGQLCELLSNHGIECSVVGYRGGHDFPSAAVGFSEALPWLAGRLGTPGVAAVPLPGA